MMKKGGELESPLFFLLQWIYIVNMKDFRFIILVLLVFAVFSLSQAIAFEYQGLDGEVGFLWKHNEGYDTEKGDSGPDLLTFFPGVSAFFTFNERFFFKPSLFLYTETLQYLPERDYTIPVDQANIDSMSVLGIMVEPAVGYSWKFGSRHTFGVQTGLGFHFQIPLWGPGEDDRSEMQDVLMEEWFFINPGIWYYNPLTERFGFTFRAETCLPVYNTFVNRDLPFSDSLSVVVMFGVRVIVQ